MSIWALCSCLDHVTFGQAQLTSSKVTSVKHPLSLIEAILFNPDRRVAAAGLAVMILSGVLVAVLLVALLGPLYAAVFFLGVACVFMVLRDIRWGLGVLLAVLALLPFAALPFKLGFTPTFLDLALLAVYTVWIVRVATRRDRELAGTSLGVPVMLFLLLACFAFVNGARFGMPTVTTIRNFAELMLGIGLFFLLVNILHTEEDLLLVARLIILAGAGAAAIAVIMYVIPQTWTVRLLDSLSRLSYPGGAGALRYIEDDPANPMRAIGTMVDPNVLGGFLILVAGLTAPQLVGRQPLFRRPWVAAFLLFELIALYLTYSRGSLVGLAAGLLLIGLLRYRRLLVIAALAVGLVLLLPPAQAYVAHFVQGVQLQDQATQMRLGEYRDALTLIGRYPVFGVGFAGSPDADLYVGVSSLYLLMAEEMGVIGVLSFLIVVVGYLVNLGQGWARTRDSNPRLEALFLGLGAAVTGVMVGGFLDHYLFNLVYPHMSTLFWIYLGLGLAAARLVARGGQRGAAPA
jgi:polysaccharide biosynthesis protein PslJ